MNLFGAPTIEFCEKAGDGIIKRPFYALSNIAYLFVGLLILSKKTKLSKAFGYTALFIGFASFMYDASYTYLSQLVDLFGMLLFINVPLYFSAKRYFKITTRKLVLIQTLLISLGMFLIVYFKSFSGAFIFGSFIVMVTVLELLLWQSGQTKGIKQWLVGLALFVLGFIVWLPDASGLLCDPSNIINGRSIFHILTSITIYLLYQYYELQERKII